MTHYRKQLSVYIPAFRCSETLDLFNDLSIGYLFALEREHTYLLAYGFAYVIYFCLLRPRYLLVSFSKSALGTLCSSFSPGFFLPFRTWSKGDAGLNMRYYRHATAALLPEDFLDWILDSLCL